MESDKAAIVFVYPGSYNNWPAKITENIFVHLVFIIFTKIFWRIFMSLLFNNLTERVTPHD